MIALTSASLRKRFFGRASPSRVLLSDLESWRRMIATLAVTPFHALIIALFALLVSNDQFVEDVEVDPPAIPDGLILRGMQLVLCRLYCI